MARRGNPESHNLFQRKLLSDNSSRRGEEIWRCESARDEARVNAVINCRGVRKATIVVVKLGRGRKEGRKGRSEKAGRGKTQSSVRNRNDPEMTSPLHCALSTTAFRRALTLLFIPRVYEGFASLGGREREGERVQRRKCAVARTASQLFFYGRESEVAAFPPSLFAPIAFVFCSPLSSLSPPP